MRACRPASNWSGTCKDAFANGEFELFYQPIVNLDDDKITSFEALLRWNHPERGVVSPAEFIPVAEEMGLIIPLGEWVLRTACAEAATWPDDIQVAVNVSSVQLTNKNLVNVGRRCHSVSWHTAKQSLSLRLLNPFS